MVSSEFSSRWAHAAPLAFRGDASPPSNKKNTHRFVCFMSFVVPKPTHQSNRLVWNLAIRHKSPSHSIRGHLRPSVVKKPAPRVPVTRAATGMFFCRCFTADPSVIPWARWLTPTATCSHRFVIESQCCGKRGVEGEGFAARVEPRPPQKIPRPVHPCFPCPSVVQKTAPVNQTTKTIPGFRVFCGSNATSTSRSRIDSRLLFPPHRTMGSSPG